MRVAVSGLGNTGLNVVEQLVALRVESLRLFDVDRSQHATAAKVAGGDLDVSFGPIDETPVDVAIFCGPARKQREQIEWAVGHGTHVVSVSDHPEEAQFLLSLNGLAVAHKTTVLVGAGFSPGLSCLLAAYGSHRLDSVDAITVSTCGTGGPACARQHHWAFKNPGLEWVDQNWRQHRGGSGRDLVWFPESIGARDCYRAALASPLLLRSGLPGVRRIGARMAANRRDRLTGRLPMLRPPHADGGVGAIRVELRGRSGSGVETMILGVVDRPARAAGIVAAASVDLMQQGLLPPGAYGLASLPSPGDFLAHLRPSGIEVLHFDGYLRV